MRDYTPPPVPASVWQNPWHFIAFGFGTGAIPFAPGTFGTLIAIPFYLAIRNFPNSIYLITVLIITVGSIWLCDKVSRELNVNDHQGMCLDEIVGYLVTMYAAPHNFKSILIGFILFRLFDIWKPQPIQYVDQKIHGGFGMILDDVLAGIYACIFLHIISWMI